MADDTEPKILHTTAIYDLGEETDLADDNYFVMSTPDKQTVKVKFSAVKQSISETQQPANPESNDENGQTGGIDTYTTDTYMKNFVPASDGTFTVKENGRYNIHCACDFGKTATNCQNVLRLMIHTNSETGWCVLCEKRVNTQDAELDCHIYCGVNVQIKPEATQNGAAVADTKKPILTITAIKQGENFVNSQETLICTVPTGSYVSNTVEIPGTDDQPYGIISAKSSCSSASAGEKAYDYSMNVHLQYSVTGTNGWRNLATRGISKANTAYDFAIDGYLVKRGWHVRVCMGAKASDKSKVSGYPSNTFLITYRSLADTSAQIKDVKPEEIDWSTGVKLNFSIGNYAKSKKTNWSGDPSNNAAYNIIGVGMLGLPYSDDGAILQKNGFVMFKDSDNRMSAIEYSPSEENHLYMPSFRNNQMSGTYSMYATDNYAALRVSHVSEDHTYETPVWASNLTSVSRFGSKMTDIDNECFNGTNITSLTIPQQISAIGLYKTFFKCHKLKTVTFTNGAISSIGGRQYETVSHTFTDCSSLTSVNLEALSCCHDNMYIGNYMFRNCTALSSLDLRCFSQINFTNDTNHEPFKGCKNIKDIYFSYEHFMNFKIDKKTHTHMMAGVTASNKLKLSIYLVDVPDNVDAETFTNSTKPKFQLLTDLYSKANITIIGIKTDGEKLTSYHLKGS